MKLLFILLVFGLVLVSGCTQQEKTDEAGNKNLSKGQLEEIQKSNTSPYSKSTTTPSDDIKAKEDPLYRKQLEVEARMKADAATFKCENLTPTAHGEINVLFIPYKFDDIGLLKRLALASSGLVDSHGIITREPFKSDKDKFNFWITDKLLDNEWTIKEYGGLSGGDIVPYGKAIVEACGLKNQFYFIVKNSNLTDATSSTYIIRISLDTLYKMVSLNCSKYDFNGDGCVNPESDINSSLSNLEKKELLACRDFCVGVDPFVIIEQPMAATVNHEFGHQFADFVDEYDISKFYETTVVLTNQSNNCFVGTITECSDPLKNTKWGKIIGNGCGADGVLDCVVGDKNYEYEIGCFEGCGGIRKGTFKASRNSIMAEDFGGEFNLAQQKIICDKIRNLTGSFSNYCNNI